MLMVCLAPTYSSNNDCPDPLICRRLLRGPPSLQRHSRVRIMIVPLTHIRAAREVGPPDPPCSHSGTSITVLLPQVTMTVQHATPLPCHRQRPWIVPAWSLFPFSKNRAGWQFTQILLSPALRYRSVAIGHLTNAVPVGNPKLPMNPG
jgi:hypothetical protein